jgi:hypothetical protein
MTRGFVYRTLLWKFSLPRLNGKETTCRIKLIGLTVVGFVGAVPNSATFESRPMGVHALCDPMIYSALLRITYQGMALAFLL